MLTAHLDENLYIGTSAGEVIHHFRIPPDPGDPSGLPTYIQAARLQPPVNQPGDYGIQQILLLPSVSKACILCNNTLTFYSLPELSPAFPQLKPLTCGWVGGVDLELEVDSASARDGVVIMMCLRNKIRLVKIHEQPMKIRDIEFGGCVATVRRGNIACVADARSYALLDVVNQQKIPLFPISSVNDQAADSSTGAALIPDEPWPDTPEKQQRSNSSVGTIAGRLGLHDRNHGRSSSLNIFGTSPGKDASRQSSRHGFDAPHTLARQPSPRPVSYHEGQSSIDPESGRADKPLPSIPSDTQVPQISAVPPPTKNPITPLRPLVVSPIESEFLLTTGTEVDEPGLGVMVNFDAEVVRGTLEFASYPEFLVIDGNGIDMTASTLPTETPPEEGYALAVVRRTINGTLGRDVEIQRWDVEPGQNAAAKEWFGISSPIHGIKGLGGKLPSSLGICSISDKTDITLPEIVQILSLKPIDILNSTKSPSDTATRESEESGLIGRLCSVQAHILLWVGQHVYWILRNPLVTRLDARLRLAQATSIEGDAAIEPQRTLVEGLANDIRGLKPRTELEFFSLSYIRQKAAALLYMDLVLRTASGIIISERDKRYTEEALIGSELDPRIVLSFLPGIRDETQQADDGIWIQGGLKDIIQRFTRQMDLSKVPSDPVGIFGDNLLQMVARLLTFWRRKKGNPSVADGKHLFPTVDAALLRILLLLDKSTPRGPATAGSTRAELNSFIDTGVDCWDRAVELLEEHKRLYVLSRLYAQKKNFAMVLATWKRIISGEEDIGGEFVDGEMELKRYLSKMKDRKLIIEYGTWLATRNPNLGVQVFADDSAKIKIEPQEALAILRDQAPAAVKYYLEYLVFGKKQSQHINELIAYYLDIVVAELESSTRSQDILLQTYETYRALHPPKPTYRQFITDNTLDAEWWHSRLRLLQLLGSNQGPSSSYDVFAILERLQPYEKQLVPEMIILNGRQGRHEDSIRLLTHGLGDFDTAISYCLLGGSSIFRPPSGSIPQEELPTKLEQSRLFGYLLLEFLQIDDKDERTERTGELLERFGQWFDVAEVSHHDRTM